MDDVTGTLPETGGTESADPVAMIAEQIDRERRPAPAAPDRKAVEAAPAEQPDPEPQDGPEGDAEDDDPDAEQPEQPEQPEVRKFTVRVDGKELEVDETELIRGYQRLSDYTRKTQSLSETRQQVEAEAQRISAEREHYARQLDQFAHVLASQMPQEPDWRRLAHEDPIGYVQQRAEWDERIQHLQRVSAERQRIAEQQTQHQRQQLQQRLAEEQQRLIDRIPEWRDARKVQAEQPAIHRTLRDAGFSDEEIATVYDSRSVVIARKAALYDQLMAAKPAVQQRVEQAPRMVKPGAAAPAPDKRKALTQQLRRSGSVEDAAKLISLG